MKFTNSKTLWNRMCIMAVGIVIVVAMLVVNSAYAEESYDQYIVYLRAPMVAASAPAGSVEEGKTNDQVSEAADGQNDGQASAVADLQNDGQASKTANRQTDESQDAVSEEPKDDVTEESNTIEEEPSDTQNALKANTVDKKTSPADSMDEAQVDPKNFVVMSKEELDQYLEKDMVAYYEPDHKIKIDDTLSLTSSSVSADQWNLTNVNVAKAWDIGCYGNDVRVAVIDTGVYAHEDLQANLLPGKNYVTNETDTDIDGHGTFVAGLIAAEANGAYIDGIANHAKIVPLKVIASDGGNVSDCVAAIYAAVNVYHCDVINMSYGCDESDDAEREAVEYALEKGCILVAAAGNGGDSTIKYPAGYDGVIGVGAVDVKNQIRSTSQRNKTVDVVAPGSAVKSLALPPSTTKYGSGTSCSAPHVSAMAAIAKCINPEITADEFQELLQETSIDLGAAGYDTTYGWGLINIKGMVDKMLENTPYFISPVAEDDREVSVTVYNNSRKQLTVREITGKYREKQLLNVSVNDAIISAGGTRVYRSYDYETLKFMFMDRTNGWKPLAANRTCDR